MRLVLASASPRRVELLKAAGYVFDTLAVDVDEAVGPGESPEAYVARLASEKSAAGLERLGPASGAGVAVLGADTTVVADGRILAKPLDDSDARAMLRRLSGRAHEVMTGVSLRTAMGEHRELARTVVWFTPLTPAEVEWYVGTGEGRDKAGAYAIQGFASRFIPRIEGSYANVVGLPVHAVASLLARL